MKVKSDSYKLTKLNGNYEKVAEALRSGAMMHSVVENREQFYMPGGQVTLQLRRVDADTFLDVTRTCLFEPRYVKNIVRQLGGRWSGSSETRGAHPDKTIELFLGSE
jgi:hypothetical protein